MRHVSSPLAATRNPKRFELDALDKRIIEQLQNDGRRSFTSIAQRLQLSESTVRTRAMRMLHNGVMQIVAITDPLSVGFHMMCVIGIRMVGDTRKAAEVIGGFQEVSYVILCAGKYDMVIEVVCEDNESLLTFLNEKLRTVPGVGEIETSVYLDLYKQSYQWGTR